MKTIVLASNNPVKVQAALNGFRRMFPDEKFQAELASAASEVRDQPMSDQETLQGALNRARNAARLMPDADFWVGIEGGVEEMGGEVISFSWVVVRSRDTVGKGRTGAFFLPPPVADLIRQGQELGQADDIVFNRSNSKQDNGAVGLLTRNVVDRAQLYEQAVILALVPFKNTELYRCP
jgi:inosine/xanthosine triphosphatase